MKEKTVMNARLEAFVGNRMLISVVLLLLGAHHAPAMERPLWGGLFIEGQNQMLDTARFPFIKGFADRVKCEVTSLFQAR